MTETGLLIAQAAILVLLFGFVVAIVRSAGKQLNRAVPPVLPLEDPVDRDTAAHAIVTTPEAPPVEAAPEPWPHTPAPPAAEPWVPIPTEIPRPDAAWADELDHETVGDRTPEDANAPYMDLEANLQPRLVVDKGPGLVVGTVFPLGQGLTIGRSRSNELHVDDTFVSHMHARILRRGPFYYVEDLGSTNGTFVNDQRIERSSQLRVRDTLRMGETVLRYEE